MTRLVVGGVEHQCLEISVRLSPTWWISIESGQYNLLWQPTPCYIIQMVVIPNKEIEQCIPPLHTQSYSTLIHWAHDVNATLNQRHAHEVIATLNQRRAHDVIATLNQSSAHDVIATLNQCHAHDVIATLNMYTALLRRWINVIDVDSTSQ